MDVTPLLLLRPVRVRSIVIGCCVCVSVCVSVHEHISKTAGPIFTKFSVGDPWGRGSVLLRRCHDTLCTSGFVDNVTFCHNGSYGQYKGHSNALWQFSKCDNFGRVCATKEKFLHDVGFVTGLHRNI